jgi:hypothetical protein
MTSGLRRDGAHGCDAYGACEIRPMTTPSVR